MTEEKAKPTMLTYIESTPDQLKDNIANRGDLVGELARVYVEGGYERVFIVACGSSSNASQCAKPFMVKYLGHDVQIVPQETFCCYEHVLGPTDFVFAISQTGCSTNTIAALDKLRELGRPSIGLTGNLDSDFKEHASILVDYGVGKEDVSYVTRGVSTLALFLMLFALEASHDKGLIDDREYADVVSELEKAPDRHRIMQKNAHAFYESHKAVLTSMDVVYSCGFAQGYGLACESALKMGETIKVPSFAYEAEEYIHGPNLQITPNYTFFFYDDLGVSGDRLRTIWRATRSVSNEAYCITDSREIDDEHAVRVPFDDIHEPMLEPIYVLPVCQIIAYRASTDLDSWDNHPMFSEFSKIAVTKTASISHVMPY